MQKQDSLLMLAGVSPVVVGQLEKTGLLRRIGREWKIRRELIETVNFSRVETGPVPFE